MTGAGAGAAEERHLRAALPLSRRTLSLLLVHLVTAERHESVIDIENAKFHELLL